MDRPKVPVKHAAKKGYFVALQNAFFIWDEDQMADLRERMKKAGKRLTKKSIRNCTTTRNCLEVASLVVSRRHPYFTGESALSSHFTAIWLTVILRKLFSITEHGPRREMSSMRLEQVYTQVTKVLPLESFGYLC